MTYPNNLIILTTGSSGSSVLAGLISSQGYWLGEKTKSLDFNTYENDELVELNMELLKMSGYNRRDANDIPGPDIDAIQALKDHQDLSKFEQFLAKCNQNGPWLWKDPRLAYTIHFWEKFDSVRSADFVFIDRDPGQSYSGLILSRKIPMSIREQGLMNESYVKSFDRFFNTYQLPLYECRFEDLILKPDTFIHSMNNWFDLNITMADLESVYHGKLFKTRYRRYDFIKAKIIYFLYRYLKRDFIRFPRGRDNQDIK